jgi:hypothetical protein
MRSCMLAVLGLAVAQAGCDFGDNYELGRPCTGGMLADCDRGEEIDASPSDPDAGGVPDDDAGQEELCTLVEQTGCPDGQACDLDDEHLSEGATACRPIDEDGDEESTCAEVAECGAGYTCVSDPAGGGSCMAWCAGHADCDGPGSSCRVQLIDEEEEEIPGATLCTQACNPITSNGCPATWACRIEGQSAGIHTRCRPSGDGRQMDPCDGDGDCDHGFACVDGGVGVTCLRSCRVGVLGVCAAFAGTTCRGFVEPTVIGGIEYGACL